jgi:hypothetical protein
MNDDKRSSLEAQTRDAQNDPRSTYELISIALTEMDDQAGWEAVVTLHFRGTKEVLDAARQLCASDCPQERTLGADILGQLGVSTRSFPGESVKILLKLLEGETDEEVLKGICSALGHIHDPTVIAALSRLKTHPSTLVRYGLVFGLLAFEEDLSIQTLIELSRDQDELVRDWATFGLGSQIDADTPQIREALFARLFDPDEVTRGEAFVGLARRKDQRIIDLLIKELNGYPSAEYNHSLEAAAEIADARLLPVLTGLKQAVDSDDETLDEAIRCCSQGARPEDEKLGAPKQMGVF